MHRFFCSPIKTSDRTATVTDKDEIHHLKNVLRLKNGTEVCLFDGQGTEVEGKILSIQKSSVQVTVAALRRQAPAAGLRVTLACAVPKRAKFEFIIEKCTELGINEIVPLKTKRTEFRLTKANQGKKLKRYQTVALNAAKQAKRKIVPRIQPVRRLPEFIAQLPDETQIIIPCLTGRREALQDVLNRIRQQKRKTAVAFLIGPEGDFTAEEITATLKAGGIPVTLGEHTLKVDTAAITVVAAARILLDSV